MVLPSSDSNMVWEEFSHLTKMPMCSGSPVRLKSKVTGSPRAMSDFEVCHLLPTRFFRFGT